jgi:hypothetical protein
MAFPDTTLGSDVQDPEFGGQPANRFGLPNWQWINSVIQWLERAYLTYLRVPYTTVVVTSQSSALVGDVAIWDGERFLAGGLPYVSTLGGGAVQPFILGIYLESVGASGKARVAINGIIPAAVAGIGTQTSVQVCGLNVANGRLRVALGGDLVMGTIDLQGNVLFSGYGAS